MVPAMDRMPKTSALWLRGGLALALCSADLGCSRLKSGRRDNSPPMLGMQRASRDAYADIHRSKAATPSAELLPAGPAVDSPMLAQGPEVGRAIRSAAPSDPGGALQPPVSAEPPRPASASTGVPNASLLLASSEPRAASTPATADPARIVAEARAALDRMATYHVAMHRQERVNGTLQPEEDVILAIRREPKAVRLTWPSGPHQGREVLYRADEPGGLMHVKLANSALPIPRLSIPPDSPMVMRNSRHPVTEAGFDPLIRGMEDALKSPGDSGLSYADFVAPAPLDQPHHCLVQTAPSGEVSRVYIDPKTHLPALFAADDANGEPLERYVFRDVRPNPPDLATADAFDPNARWGPPRGLLGRITRGSADVADASASSSPR